MCFSTLTPGCLTLADKESLETRVQELKTSETKLKLENAQLKEVAEVARQQSVAMEMWQKSRDLEMSSLRHQLLDLQMQSDEKTVAGKLHHQIVTLEISEATALKKVEEANSKVCKCAPFPPSNPQPALNHLSSHSFHSTIYMPSCKSVQKCAKVCKSVQECARVCKSMQECARVCKSVQECARVCNSYLAIDSFPVHCSCCYLPCKWGYSY